DAEVADAARDHQPNVAVLLLVTPYRLAHCGTHLLARQRHLQGERLCRGVEAIEMRSEAKDAAIVHANTLEDPVTVEQSMIENRDFGGVWRMPFAVNVDLHVALRLTVRSRGLLRGRCLLHTATLALCVALVKGVCRSWEGTLSSLAAVDVL